MINGALLERFWNLCKKRRRRKREREVHREQRWRFKKSLEVWSFEFLVASKRSKGFFSRYISKRPLNSTLRRFFLFSKRWSIEFVPIDRKTSMFSDHQQMSKCSIETFLFYRLPVDKIDLHEQRRPARYSDTKGYLYRIQGSTVSFTCNEVAW